MNSKCLVVIGLLGLVGCVQKTTYRGSDQTVVAQDVDHVAAARERLSLGLAYLRRGDSEQAKYNFERALKHTPNDSEALLAMGYYFDAVKDVERAEGYYRRAVNTSPFNADAANNLGVFLCKQEQYEEADKWLNRAVSSDGYIRLGQTYENLGLCAQKAGWTERAADYYQKALNHDPRRSASLLQVAELQYQTEKLDDARFYLERYHNNGNESAASLWLGAELEFEANNTDAARRYGVLLLAKYPTSAQAKEYRTKYY
ncbi:type IV pilus biogenesis/stability protein PilW [Ferrimonas lipolytica]|uniref:Type IV pilus biogenesis/stability protein PilW n=1 Tax=Ferrimonas lipolytica TaxID=2724191 RepID=A0A6H1UED2_9GAMM|nr:type IV pilus biogenesis/stability protein PilW [Ferrimonas lipolytica]QIZ76989.1 type IV pilus biogenesis/stability protein PilW [Ferrimonas lipolytica]